MSFLRVIPYLVVFLQATPQTVSRGTVQGTIVRAGSAEPLQDVRVTLQQEAVGLTNLPPGAVLRSSAARTVVSDRAGHFVINDVDAGEYTISLLRDGYSGSTSNASRFTVTGNETTEVRLSMVQGGVISGRVLDSSGQLMANATVQALSRVFENGVSSLRTVASRTTDDRGEYRLFGVPAGTYYLSATPRATAARPATLVGSHDARTFFPSASSTSLAETVRVGVGEETRGMDITMASRFQARVRGRIVSDLTPRIPDTPAALYLIPSDLEAQEDSGAVGSASVVLKTAAAEFEIPNVEPGVYDLFAILETPDGPAIGRIRVEVLDMDVTNAIVIVQSGVQVQGTVTVDGKSDPGSTASINLQPLDSLIRTPARFAPSAAGEPGAFTFNNVPEGRFRVSATLPAGLYVEDVQQNEQSVYDSGFEVRSGSAVDPLHVIVKSDAGIVEAVVRDSSGTPLAGFTVALVPDTRRSNPELYKSGITDAAGTFVLRGIAPGEYRIFAWEGAISGAYQSPAFLSQYEEYGLPVIVNSGARTSIQVSVTDPENR